MGSLRYSGYSGYNSKQWTNYQQIIMQMTDMLTLLSWQLVWDSVELLPTDSVSISPRSTGKLQNCVEEYSVKQIDFFSVKMHLVVWLWKNKARRAKRTREITGTAVANWESKENCRTAQYCQNGKGLNWEPWDWMLQLVKDKIPLLKQCLNANATGEEGIIFSQTRFSSICFAKI